MKVILLVLAVLFLAVLINRSHNECVAHGGTESYAGRDQTLTCN